MQLERDSKRSMVAPHFCEHHVQALACADVQARLVSTVVFTLLVEIASSSVPTLQDTRRNFENITNCVSSSYINPKQYTTFRRTNKCGFKVVFASSV